jgi:flagellar M-ring protein FliF
MSFLGNLTSDLNGPTGILSPARRWFAAALVCLIIVSLIMLWQPTTTEYANLFSGRQFSPTELTQIEQAFAAAGLEKWQVSGGQIQVPREEKPAYLTALQDVIEPDTLNADMDSALKSSSLWEPRHIKDLKIKHAEEKQLSRMLASMKFIENVTVRKDQVDNRGLRGSRETTALAAVKPTGDMELDGDKAYAIRNAVAACYAGLSSEHVTVLDLNSGRVFGGDNQADAVATDPYANRKRHFEQLYEDRIHAELSPEIDNVTVEMYVALNYTEQEDNVTTSQQPTTPNSHDSATLIPQHVVASITIPKTYYGRLVRRQTTTSQDSLTPLGDSTRLKMIQQATIHRIRKRVTQLLQIPVSAKLQPPTAMVHINSPADPSRMIANTPEQPASIRSFAQSSWPWLGCILAAVLGSGALLYWGPKKPTTLPLPEPVHESTASPEPTTIANPAQPPENNSTLETATSENDQLRSQLTDRIRQNPDVAADVLQSWLKDAA